MQTIRSIVRTVSGTTKLSSLLNAALFAIAGACWAATPSDLLEQAIYSEETKGDLEGAMRLYQQVVAEAKDAHSVAAQAQYQLGVCLHKKKNFSEAKTAFEQLINNYPDEKELVSRARAYLTASNPLLPAPWADGEEEVLDIKFPTGFKIGVMRYCVVSGEIEGRKIWRLSSLGMARGQTFSRVETEADTFKPIHSRWKHTLIGDVETGYTEGRAEMRTFGKDGVKTVDLEAGVLDNEECVQWMRRLPLVEGYKNSAKCLASLGGGQTILVKLEVVGREKLQVPAGAFDSFKVELNIGQTFWYSADQHHYLVKFEAGGAIAELTSIQVVKPGDAVKYQNAALGFSLSAPPGWLFDAPELRDKKDAASLAILDPEALVTGIMTVRPVVNLKAEEKKSARVWAEMDAAEQSKTAKDFQIRAESWSERTVAGHPGAGFVADLTEGKAGKSAYVVHTLGGTNAAWFYFVAGTNDFPGLRAKFDAIIDSYHGN